jgi:hypothetical protein
MDARIAAEPMLNNQKIPSFGGQMAKSAAYGVLHLGAPRKLPDYRIDKTPRQL